MALQPLPRPYRAPSWLPGGHAQTLYAALGAPRPPALRFDRHRVNTPDHDFFDIDYLTAREPARHGLLLFHGLEGSARSHYVRPLAHACAERGWHFALVYFRGCSGSPNQLPRAYHAADSAAIASGVHHAVHTFPQQTWFACGISLGGNALLKHLAACPSSPLAGAATVSAPLDLFVAGEALDQRRLNRWLYTRHFLGTLKVKALAKTASAPELLCRDHIRRARTLRAFDDAYTAPVHGFSGVLDYWRQASVLSELRQIQHRCLLINARNDPFLPASALPDANEVPAHLVLEQPASGGHVGFVEGPFPGQLDWLPERIFHFFEHGN